MIDRAKSYDYPPSGMYNETVGTLVDGRVVTINTQYAAVLPHGEHADDCDQVNKLGGRCTCGLLDGIDVDALIADAVKRGLRGPAPRPEAEQPADDTGEWLSRRGLTLSEEIDREDTIY